MVGFTQWIPKTGFFNFPIRHSKLSNSQQSRYRTFAERNKLMNQKTRSIPSVSYMGGLTFRKQLNSPRVKSAVHEITHHLRRPCSPLIEIGVKKGSKTAPSQFRIGNIPAVHRYRIVAARASMFAFYPNFKQVRGRG